jgi:hypothetical protein
MYVVIYQCFVRSHFETKFFISAVDGIHGPFVPDDSQEIKVCTFLLQAQVKPELARSTLLSKEENIRVQPFKHIIHVLPFFTNY